MSTVPDQARRIGVFGGAFDPPHLGHRALAQAALTQLQLDALCIIPTGQAWHKNRALTPALHRLAMAQLAFAGLERVCIDPRETRRPGASYTVDTLRELHHEHPQAQLFLILGQDQAQALTSWHRWEEIPQLAIICVADRAGFSGGESGFNALSSEVPDLHRLEMPPVDVSATDIRQHLANHQSVAPLVFEPVARYIALHHLYQTA